MSAYIDDIIDYLQTNSLGTVGTNLFSGYMPDDEDIVVAFDNVGLAPDPEITTIRHPSFQIMIVNNTFSTGQTKLEAIRTLLHEIRNTQIGGHFYYYILAQSEGGYVGKDDIGRHTFSVNFVCKAR